MKARSYRLVVGAVIVCAVAMSACSQGAKPARQVSPSATTVSSGAGTAPASASSTPVLVAPAAAVLKPSKLTYVARLFSQGQAHRLGWRTLELSNGTFEGKNVWLLAEKRTVNTVVLAESLYVAKGSLEPVHRVVHTADMDISTNYTRDSILTSFGGDSGGNVRVAIPNERDLMATSTGSSRLLASLPLAPGWKGSATTEFVGPHDHARVVPTWDGAGQPNRARRQLSTAGR